MVYDGPAKSLVPVAATHSSIESFVGLTCLFVIIRIVNAGV